MCVIVVQKDKFPGWDTLKNCWDRNPHGAGYMYQRDGKVIISKGYTCFKEFKNSVELVPNYRHIPIVYHFRIATHGTIVPENTHPFPLGRQVKFMKALDLSCSCAIAHNGIITKKMYDEKERAKYNLSDTGEFIREIVEHSSRDGHISKKAIQTYLECENRLSGSRFVMMDADSVKTFGEFYEYNGCLFSNNHSHISYEYCGGLYGK